MSIPTEVTGYLRWTMESEQKSENQDRQNGHTLKDTVDDGDDDFVMEPCGVGPCRPSLFQHMASIPCFVGWYSIIGLLSQSLNTYLASQIPSIEKQFGLSSAFSGILLSFNDIGYLSVCLFISSFAPYMHIPRVLCAAFLLYGFSGLICSLPHFVSLASGTLPSLTPNDVIKDNLSSSLLLSPIKSQAFPLCDLVSGNTSILTDDACVNKMNKGSDTDETYSKVRTIFLAIFGTGMVLQGIGKSLRGPFVTVYIDDNGEKRKTGFYLGIIIALAIAGPSIAFVVGGIFSRIYVTLEDVDISPRDPRWIGAWWIGFMMFGGAAVIFALPMAFFPRHLKKPKAIIVKGKTTKDMKIMGKIKERLTSFRRCFSNTVWLCLLFSTTLHLGSIGGYLSFLSKYIKIQFNIPLWQANMILASLKVAVGLGTFVGGLLTRMINLTPRRTIGLMISIYTIYVVVFTSSLFLGCDQPKFVGPEKYHPNQNVTTQGCSSGCDCKDDVFFPVCGSNGVNYHSPCYAGCSAAPQKGQIFNNCTCIPDGRATSGECESDCNTIYPFAVLCVIGGLLNALLISPGYIAKLRCVEDRDKATALGCMAFFGSVLGWMPTPIIIGKVIDTTCIIWQNTCESSGACLYYLLSGLRIKVNIVILGYKVVSLALLFLALYLVRNLDEWPQNAARKEGTSEKDVTSPEEMKTLVSVEAEVNDEQNEKIPAV
ncbi:solute carrier organic anion transporter family member 2A1-like isoform X1 [Mizuhopecten yessoensis]|uniref:solute carrier organic anion transporter family member 2A1-like isoform X1 n=2 Tax=Mizuhopecten yessoensis TaxID=6573 RepID=UPI000B45E0CD|nr:solute carrier organic anion transporter family member 2A1-like isoform X1 [Mizuhopecten yessoensis]